MLGGYMHLPIVPDPCKHQVAVLSSAASHAPLQAPNCRAVYGPWLTSQTHHIDLVPEAGVAALLPV